MTFHQAPISHIRQVKLFVHDLERSIAFYKEAIGFQVYHRKDKLAHLTPDGERILLTLEEKRQARPKQSRRTGLYHFAILLPSRADLANLVRHWLRIGIQFAASDHGVSEALYLSDPDGHGIEIYVDRDPATWLWRHDQVEMVTEPLQFDDLLAEPASDWTSLPKHSLMGHIHLHVSDLDEAENFYTKGLSFNVISRFQGSALFLSDGDYHHHIGLNIWNGRMTPRPDPDTIQLDHFVIEYANETKRQEVIQQLQALEARLEMKDGQVMTVDPAGNRISLSIAK